MKAGRELDAIVAEKIFGYRFWLEKRGGYEMAVLSLDEPWNGFRYDSQEREKVRYREVPSKVAIASGFFGDGPAYYSTDMAAAWPLVDRIREIVAYQKATQTYSFQLCQTGIPGDWFCSFVINEGDFSTQASVDDVTSAPLAICLAALKAVGHE